MRLRKFSNQGAVTTPNTYSDLGELAATTGLVDGATQTQVLACTAGGQLLQKSVTSGGSTATTDYEVALGMSRACVE